MVQLARDGADIPPFRLAIRVRLCVATASLSCAERGPHVSLQLPLPRSFVQRRSWHPARHRLLLAAAPVLVAFTLAVGCGGGADFNTGSCSAIRAHIRQHSDIGDGSDLYVWWESGSAYWSDSIDDIPDLANTSWMSLYWLADERC